MDTKRLFSVEQAARLLGKDPKTVRQWADSGKVYCERTKGGHRRVDISPYLPEEAIRSADLSFSKRGKKKESTKNLPVNELPVIVVGYCIQLGKKYKGCADKQEQLILNRYPSAEIIVEDRTATVGTSIADSTGESHTLRSMPDSYNVYRRMGCCKTDHRKMGKWQ